VGAGLLVSVTETPASPPVDQRARRLVNKVQAGAGWCLIGATADRFLLEDFVAATLEGAPGVRLIVGIPVVTSRDALDLLGRYPTSPVPASILAALDGSSPHTATLDAALSLAVAALSIDGVAGVNLAAPAVPGASTETASDVASLGRALGGGP
jgi:hypothetical protein